MQAHTSTAREFPDDYDLVADIAVQSAADAHIPTSLWENALHYDGPDIEEQLCNPGLYHAVIDQPLVDVLIGLAFSFRIDDDNRIVADGTAHPAQRICSNIHTDTDTTLERVQIHIKPKDPESETAMREYILAMQTQDERTVSDPGATTAHCHPRTDNTP